MSTEATPRVLCGLQDMPSPKGLPFIGTKLSLMAAVSDSGIHKYIDSRHKELGPIFRDSVGPVDAIFVSDADVMRTVFMKMEGKHPMHILPDPWVIYNKKYKVKRGIFFMDGEEWLDMRRILNKLLLKINTETWIEPPIDRVVEDLVIDWKRRCLKHGFVPDLNKETYRLSINVTLSVMLGSAYSKSFSQFDQLLGKFSAKVEDIFILTANMYLFPASYYANLNLPIWKKFVDACDTTLHYGRELVDALLKLEDIGDGLLARLLQEGMSKDDITRVVTDFIMAAGDTTAFTTQWALYLICRHSNSRVLTAEPRGIVKEAMRLYPAAAFLTRVLPADCELANYHIPAGSIIIMSLYTSGRDPKYFSQPLEFMPERWSKENSGMVKCSHATMPFAMGARSCIGRRIAMVQLKKTIGKILENFDIHLVVDKPVEAAMECVLKPKEDIKILVTPRT